MSKIWLQVGSTTTQKLTMTYGLVVDGEITSPRTFRLEQKLLTTRNKY